MLRVSCSFMRIGATGRFIKFGHVHLRQRFIHVARRVFFNPQPYISSRTVDLDNQSVLLPGPERARASSLVDDPTKFIADVPHVKIETVYDVLDYGLQASNDGDCVGSRSAKTGEYEWIKYSEVILRTQFVGSALIKNGLKPSNESYVGIFASNRTEFLLTLYACAGYSMVLVPLYDSLGAENVNFIINQVNFPLVIANNNKNALNVLQAASRLQSLKTLVIMDDPSPEVISCAQNFKINLVKFSEFEMEGKNNKTSPVLPKPDDLFCIPYTSGTTGIPKGVMLTHKNAIACLASLVIAYGPGGIFGGTILSYLPPAHIYEIMNEVASLYFARRIAFFGGDIKKIFEDVQYIKPTILPLVPRLMNLMYTKAFEEMKSAKWKYYLMKLALSRKEKMIKKGKICNDTVWDKIVFKKFQAFLGGNVRMIITTSAPISQDIMRFFRCASGCYIFEAYGQTEVLGATMTVPFEHDGGSVGPPLPCNHVKLTDVPDLNYFSKNDVGEICFKGPNVFRGYFKNPDATKESIDSEGWHHSGDIGRWLPNGTLKVIDRKKHLFKLSQGEYIAPEKVENAYSHSKLVLQVYVDGLSNKDYIIAIVVPDPNNIFKWAESCGFSEKDQLKLIQDKSVRKKFMEELHKHGKREELNALEQVKNLCLVTEPFSVENGLLTPTFKLKRNEARKYFDSVLQKLYEEGPLVTSSKE